MQFACIREAKRDFLLNYPPHLSCNFRSYRSTFNAAISRSESATDDRQRVTIPFFSLFVKDIYFARENARLDLDGHALDLEKAGAIAAKVREFCRWKDAPNCPYEKNAAVEKFLRKSPVWRDDGGCEKNSPSKTQIISQ